MQMVVAEIPVEVRKKKIRNMNLYVKPPDGRVLLTAPYRTPEQEIRRFLTEKEGWIRKQRAGMLRRMTEAPQPLRYQTGDVITIWGVPRRLVFRPNVGRKGFLLRENEAVLTLKPSSTARERESFVREQYKGLMRTELERLLPKWEAATGLSCQSYRLRLMRSRWGSCNTVTGRLTFNTLLAEKPKECLEYVVLHELAHLYERRHNERFWRFVAQYMPHWRAVRRRLNEAAIL